MGDICDWPPDDLRRVIRESNEQSAIGTQQYITWENQAILNDYEFVECSCDRNCWCKRHSCPGHYRIRAISSDEFLQTYVKLWVPPKARQNVMNAVQRGASFNGRQRNAVEPLRWLQSNWSNVLDYVLGYNRCGLCDSPLPAIEGVTNLYQAKMWLQLFYDCIVPFDTRSRTRIIKAGYPDPTKLFMSTNHELFHDLRVFSERAGMDIGGIRNLDVPWDVVIDLRRPVGGQPLSRVVDKMFYVPK